MTRHTHTDRQTHDDGIYHASIASCGKNCQNSLNDPCNVMNILTATSVPGMTCFCYVAENKLIVRVTE